MSQQPPKELFLLIWDNPWLVLVTHDISDWGHKTEAPKYWIRYEFGDFGTIVEESDGSDGVDGDTGGDAGSLDSEEESEADGDDGPLDE